MSIVKTLSEQMTAGSVAPPRMWLNGRLVPPAEARLDFLTPALHYGIAAFEEPGLMDQPVFFHVRSHGYEFPKDGFGYRGKALPVREGGTAQLKVKRINVAERLYRVTGGGIYRAYRSERAQSTACTIRGIAFVVEVN